jgi:hypothetical protein
MDALTLKINRRLVEKECCNHQFSGPNDISHHCWAMEVRNKGRCLYFSEPVQDCNFFIGAVQPLLSKKKPRGG